MTDEGPGRYVLRAFRARWVLMVIVATGFSTGAILGIHAMKLKYEGRAVVVFRPRPGIPNASADTIKLIASALVPYVTAPDTISKIVAKIDRIATTPEPQVDAAVTPETSNLVISVRASSPRLAALVANALAEQVVRYSSGSKLATGALVRRAQTPRQAAGVSRTLTEVAAVIAGVLLALVIGVLVERMRPRLRSPREIGESTGVPVLGTLPRSRVVPRRPREAFADAKIGSAVRTLRTNFLRTLKDGFVEVVAVTSPTTGEGKTTVAALFAESLGHLGAKVLLVDADLRRPSIATTYSPRTSVGTREVLREDAVLEDAVQPAWADGLSLLATSPDPEGGDLLARRFPTLVADARESYEFVVVDTPPLLATDDARTMAAAVDAVLLVVSVGSLEDSARKAIEALRILQTRVVGIVANGAVTAEETYDPFPLDADTLARRDSALFRAPLTKKEGDALRRRLRAWLGQ